METLHGRGHVGFRRRREDDSTPSAFSPLAKVELLIHHRVSKLEQGLGKRPRRLRATVLHTLVRVLQLRVGIAVEDCTRDDRTEQRAQEAVTRLLAEVSEHPLLAGFVDEEQERVPVSPRVPLQPTTPLAPNQDPHRLGYRSSVGLVAVADRLDPVAPELQLMTLLIPVRELEGRRASSAGSEGEERDPGNDRDEARPYHQRSLGV